MATPLIDRLQVKVEIPVLWEREIFFLFHDTLNRARRLIETTDDFFENPFDEYNLDRLKDLVEDFQLSEREFKEIVFYGSIREEERTLQMSVQERARLRWE